MMAERLKEIDFKEEREDGESRGSVQERNEKGKRDCA